MESHVKEIRLKAEDVLTEGKRRME